MSKKKTKPQKEKKRLANLRRKQAKFDRGFYDRLSEPCKEHNDKNCNNFNCYMIDQKKIYGEATQFYSSDGASIELKEENGKLIPNQ